MAIKIYCYQHIFNVRKRNVDNVIKIEQMDNTQENILYLHNL